jgi:glycosyltransferase involved in cell wall biosynthesis
MVRQADRVLMCSDVHVQRLAADTGLAKAAFAPCLKSEGALLPPPPAAPVATVVYMGLLRTSKGVPLLLSLAGWFEQNGCRLVLWGRDAEGVLPPALPRGVEWRGEYDPDRDLDRIVGEAACLALPFREGEGLPIVISEALSRGVPVATFGFSGIDSLRDLHPGLAIVDGEAGRLTEEIQRLARAGRDPAFRASLRAAYLRRLGNERCVAWWTNFIHGN